MAYDEERADRTRGVLAPDNDLTKQKMFGGLSFMVGRKMCCGIINDDPIVLVGPGGYRKALDQPRPRPMDFTKITG